MIWDLNRDVNVPLTLPSDSFRMNLYWNAVFAGRLTVKVHMFDDVDVIAS